MQWNPRIIVLLLVATRLACPTWAAEGSPSAGEAPPDVFELPEVQVIANTPWARTGIDKRKFSGNVQSSEDEDIRRHEAFALPDFMNRRLESVNINDVQNNPYQPDITYRGFEASPLLGTPIGLSVYQDGVRVNEPFGDIVNWDLIPQVAIANMEVIPGSNPLFGLNTLGGALAIRTKSGFSHPGAHAQAYGGSYGRNAYQGEYGGSQGQFDWYFAGNIFEDGGWRPFSPTNVRQAFGKVGWENEKTDIDFSFTFANNSMQGVGPTPPEDLSRNYRAIFTAPDITDNTLYFFNLNGTHEFTKELTLSGNIYNRNNTSTSLNSNTNDDCELITDPFFCFNDTGEQVPSANFAATRTVENGTGSNLQLTSNYKVLEHENQLSVGGGYNMGNTVFGVAGQDAVLVPGTRYMVATTPLATTTKVNGLNYYTNVFATDTFSVLPWVHVNGSVNWIQAQVQLNDKLGTALNGKHTFSRINPSVGFTVNPLDRWPIDSPLKELTLYGNYNEGLRAPTAVELSCANPDAPCSLPNSFVSDPPLKPAVSHTFEAGARGKFSDALQWNLAVYQSRVQNDILFVSSPNSIISGFFKNFPATRRQGIEAGVNYASDRLNWYLSYGFVDATYQASSVLQNALGPESVKPGDRIPGIPQNTLKAGAEYQILPGWFFGGDLQYASNQYARGDDANVHPQVSGWAVMNLNTRYVLTRNVELFAMGRNIFNNHYATFGMLNHNSFDGINSAFLGPGAPATGYAGVRVQF